MSQDSTRRPSTRVRLAHFQWMYVVKTMCQTARNAEMWLLVRCACRVFTLITTLEGVYLVATTGWNVNSVLKAVVFYVTLVSSSME